ncbi:hypothetical protein PGT21_012189 [Puccinia graminis f. sp. tritici]|uniref:Uncharacterized protein n=1 Tax=Puccinia graminis f. sp. tritici TaxID=56615 RepID=A0A5B0NA70_PUCGR|nr:hypothetical protein PGTUg99_004640 [Puccinia graminis f. sp. tritici]KAA1095094.1 hypothetical protein PGT21_035480 [Puccinia graminis f. sp. tritici]KAA1118987.1 hypothetical protein PGT21_012189 [Puccinia graminis f. sp. tritici]KAA1121356.1 hypothetical protein PGTUg99_014441 [Puccinia graminis f. sp. tritici]
MFENHSPSKPSLVLEGYRATWGRTFVLPTTKSKALSSISSEYNNFVNVPILRSRHSWGCGHSEESLERFKQPWFHIRSTERVSL